MMQQHRELGVERGSHIAVSTRTISGLKLLLECNRGIWATESDSLFLMVLQVVTQDM